MKRTEKRLKHRQGERKSKQRETRTPQTMVEGRIMRADEYESGEMSDLQIQTSDGDEYHIENGELFTNLMDKYARAFGQIRTYRDGSKSISIRKCTVMEDEEDDWATARFA